MQEIEWLNERVTLLLKKYNALRKENQKLKQKLTTDQEEIAALKEQLTSAEQRLTAVRIGQSLTDDQERMLVRRQLDGVIGDIDKILMSIDD